MNGTIFAIEEFAVYDGEGIRVNVFFKGCPLRCKWCHNPEGFLPQKQIVHSPNGCISCNSCINVCKTPGNCTLCKKCIIACPQRIIRVCGQTWDSTELANRILKLKNVLKTSGGGVTFSGGEVLMQHEFLCEVLQKTSELNRAIETSGFAKPEIFEKVLEHTDFVFFDLKVMDNEKHKFYTGVSNEVILQNARTLINSAKPFTFRVPFIHEVNADKENLLMLRDFLSISKNPVNIEFLEYNKMAGAKYALVDQEYSYSFSQPTEEEKSLAKEILNMHKVRFRK